MQSSEIKLLVMMCKDQIPAYNKYETVDCTGSHETRPLRSSCLNPTRSGEMESGLLASGTLYDYVRIECLGGYSTPVLPPSPKAYPVVSPVYIPFCFAAYETVHTLERGPVFISRIRTGDKVFGYNSQKRAFEYSTVVAVPHEFNDEHHLFSEFTTRNTTHSIRMSPNHLIVSCNKNKENMLKLASEIKINDCVKTVHGDEYITSHELVVGKGAYTIVTEADYLVVNDFVVSPFAISHRVGDAYYSIHRWLYRHFGKSVVASSVMEKLNTLVADGTIAVTKNVVRTFA